MNRRGAFYKCKRTTRIRITKTPRVADDVDIPPRRKKFGVSSLGRPAPEGCPRRLVIAGFNDLRTLQEFIVICKGEEGWVLAFGVRSVDIHRHPAAVPHGNHDIGPLNSGVVNRLRRFIEIHKDSPPITRGSTRSSLNFLSS